MTTFRDTSIVAGANRFLDNRLRIVWTTHHNACFLVIIFKSSKSKARLEEVPLYLSSWWALRAYCRSLATKQSRIDIWMADYYRNERWAYAANYRKAIEKEEDVTKGKKGTDHDNTDDILRAAREERSQLLGGSVKNPGKRAHEDGEVDEHNRHLSKRRELDQTQRNVMMLSPGETRLASHQARPTNNDDNEVGNHAKEADDWCREVMDKINLDDLSSTMQG
ncbi:uncharacterized protein ColSpa_12568 [Colletotrichum spaethianum]|uniref:Uncharacterized protein n=1 Tax=Colletotrichum spaethianum TaxID=700344 RepID=A0AA37PHM9_9PEZI|nr:uncharacterized protein ColSpa_12568 [Colletotrichum spaethianum]GKT52387.1 hypothetical protein ColSpa_12568 [Colletotrichum spaethianum]